MDEHLNISFAEAFHTEFANYSCLHELGRGGTAETYLALCRSGSLRGQFFAVKVFRRVSRPEWRANFLQEAKFLQGCEHPAVMRVFDKGVFRDEYPFVVAEYLPDTLKRTLRTNPNMIEKMMYAVQLVSALEYLSDPVVMVVHRDIKPANIFIKGRSCVLGDFGLVKRLNVEAADDREMLIASIGPRMPRYYRTPDLVAYYKGGPIPTGKSDVYQLGLVLAELFSGANPQKPMVTENFEEPIALNPFEVQGGQGAPITNLLMDMLREDPADRPTAAELMPSWQGLFISAARALHARDGRFI